MNRILFAFYILITSLITAQNQSNLTVYESQEYEDEIRTDSIQSIYTSKLGNTGIIRINNRYIFFDVFNSKLKRIYTKSEKKERKEHYIGDIFYNDEIKVFTETFPKKDEKILSLYLKNLTNKSIKKIQISSTKIDQKLSLFSNEKDAKIAISPNLKYFSILTYTIHRNQIYFHVIVFDSKTFNIIFEKQTTRNENSFFSMSDFQIDDEKNVFLLGESFYNDSSPTIKSEKNHHFFLEKISKSDNNSLIINFQDKYIKTLKASIVNNNFNLYGFYSDKSLGNIKGTCNISIDMQTLKLKNEALEELPVNVFSDLFGTDKVNQKKDKELTSFKINYILNDSQNNIYLLAEKFYITSTASGGPYGSGGSTQYHYDDILIIKFDKNGNVDWGRSIYKHDSRPSYNVFFKNDELHVILNSGKKLKNLDDGRTKTSKGFFETSALYDFVYSIEGDLSIDKIQNNKGKTYYLPNFSNYVAGKFVMISDSQSKRRFMTLE